MRKVSERGNIFTLSPFWWGIFVWSEVPFTCFGGFCVLKSNSVQVHAGKSLPDHLIRTLEKYNATDELGNEGAETRCDRGEIKRFLVL